MGLNGNPTVTVSSPNAKRAVFMGTVGAPWHTNTQTWLTFINGCKSIPGTTAASQSYGNGMYWFSTYPWHVAVMNYTHAGSPNSVSCRNPNEYFGTWLSFGGPTGSVPPNSNHPGGVNICFSDGHVQFIKDSVGYQPWWALGTRNGGETISSSQY